jgi:hypothetical protein
MPTLRILLLATIFLILSKENVPAQTPPSKKVISIREFMNRLIQSTEEELVLENLEVRWDDPSLSKRPGMRRFLQHTYADAFQSDGRLEVKSRVVVKDCSFSENLYLVDLHFAGGLEISASRFPNLYFQNCRGGGIELMENEIDNTLDFDGCEWNSLQILENKVAFHINVQHAVVHSALRMERNQVEKGEIFLLDTQVKEGSVLIGDNETLAEVVEGCTFTLEQFGEFNHYKLPGSEPADLYFTHNRIEGDSTTRMVFNKGSYLNLEVRENYFGIPVYFIENMAEERFFLVKNEFVTTVSFEKFLFSEIWNEVYWDQLKGFKLRYDTYGALDEEDYDRVIEFKNLINIYKAFHTIFSVRGDLESANACYSEMKDLQGRMLRHTYLEKSTFGNLLRWQLNVLLRIYTNHGTDPGLAVVMSFYVILLFSVFYIFFPSEWDVDSKTRLLISYERVLQSKGKTFFVPLIVAGGALFLTVLNAVTLSINSFVTLGFGKIPTRGLARYLCIIEGFIGWFLLSIFTVALINQVLA